MGTAETEATEMETAVQAAPLSLSLSPGGRGDGSGPRRRMAAAGAAPTVPGAPSPPRGEGRGEGARRRRQPPIAGRAARSASDDETARARGLRRDQSPVEAILWSRLRAGRAGAKFRRQEPIAGLTADFVCHEVRLVVEVDGRDHDARVAEDGRRDAALAALGFSVLRIPAGDVVCDAGAVAERIAGEVEKRRHAARVRDEA
jgi:crossover junction endodeoxyribonuclease RuvC